MPYSTPRIDGLPNDGRLWRLDWLGGLKRPTGSTAELTITAYFSPQLPLQKPHPASTSGGRQATHSLGMTKSGLSKLQVIGAERTKVEIGVGLLPYLEVGSWWKRGSRMQPTDSPRASSKSVQVNDRTYRIRRLSDVRVWRDRDNAVFEQPLVEALFDGRHVDEMRQTKVAVFENREGQIYLVIPCLELVRFYYCFSVRGIKALFNGDHRRLRDAWGALAKIHCADEPNVKLCLPWEFRREWPLVTTAERSWGGWARVDRVFDSISRDRLNMPASEADVGALHPECEFPATGKTDLTFHAQYFPSTPTRLDGERPSLAAIGYALQSCTLVKPDPSSIRILKMRKESATAYVDGDGNPAGRGQRKPHDQRPSRSLGRISAHAIAPESQADDDMALPTNRFDTISPEVLEVSRTDITQRVINADHADTPTTQDWMKIDDETAEEEIGSVLDGAADPANSRATEYVANTEFSKTRREAIGASLDALREKLDTLAKTYRCTWRIADHPAELGTDSAGAISFPSVPILQALVWPPEVKRWIFSEGAEPRRAMAVEVIYQVSDSERKYLYVIEIEQGPGDGFVSHLTAAGRSAGRPFTEQQLRHALERIALRQGKNLHKIHDTTSGIWFTFMKHTAPSEGRWAGNFLGKFGILERVARRDNSEQTIAVDPH